MLFMNRKLIQSPGLLGLLCLLFLAPSCEEQVLLPETGYSWPERERSYWPTGGWKSAPMEEHQVDPGKMEKADRFAGGDPLARALLVVKDGYLVFEKYYGDGNTARCSNLWSVLRFPRLPAAAFRLPSALHAPRLRRCGLQWPILSWSHPFVSAAAFHRPRRGFEVRPGQAK